MRVGFQGLRPQCMKLICIKETEAINRFHIVCTVWQRLDSLSLLHIQIGIIFRDDKLYYYSCIASSKVRKIRIALVTIVACFRMVVKKKNIYCRFRDHN